MRRGAMRIERDLVSVDLDEKKQGRVVSFLMDVESVAAWFRVVGSFGRGAAGVREIDQ
jgi:hypothetical protein